MFRADSGHQVVGRALESVVLDKGPDVDQRHLTVTAAERREKERLEKQFEKLLSSIERSIAIYGAINLRTDGHKVIFAQKLERPRSLKAKWDIYQLEPEGNGPLRYLSRH